MSVLEIIAAILLILACVFIVLVVLMQDSKQNMSQAITGASGDNYFQKNSGRSKEARLAKWTKIAAVIVFVIALLVNLITIYGWGKSSDKTSDSGSSTTTASVTTVAEESTADDTTAGDTAEDTSEAADTTAE